MKICYKCHLQKEITDFSKNCKKKDGYNSECKSCRKVMIKNWRSKNKIHEAISKKIWNKNNPDKVKIYAARAREKNSEKMKIYLKEYYRRNLDKFKLFRKKWREENLEKSNELKRLYKHRKRNAVGKYTIEQLKFRISLYNGKCWICKVKPYETVDHWKPLSKGGTNWPSNLLPACNSCNASKQSKWPYKLPQV